MSGLRMGEIIKQIEAERNRKKGVARLLGLLKEGIGGPLKWLAWNLWGRRRAIKRMQLLAGLTAREEHDDSYLFKPEKVGVIDYPQVLHQETVRRIDELRDPLPRPDVVDGISDAELDLMFGDDDAN